MGVLRFILALAVVASHSWRILPFPIVPGSVAVQAFYIISGFYMALILTDKYLTKPHSYKLFITNRILRIYPIYFFILVLTLLVYALSPEDNSLKVLINLLSQGNYLGGLVVIFSTIFIIGQETIRSSPGPIYDSLLVPQAWTLSLEFMFYFLVPFLVRLKKIYLIVIFIASIHLRLWLFNQGYYSDPRDTGFFPTELALFILGMLSFNVYQRIQHKKISWDLNILVFLAVISLTIFLAVIDLNPLFKVIFYFAAVGMGLPFIFYLTRDSRFDRWIGEFSYPIYISHILIKYIFSVHLGFTGKFDPAYGWWVAGGSFLLSYILLYAVIYPIDKIREQKILDHKL